MKSAFPLFCCLLISACAPTAGPTRGPFGFLPEKAQKGYLFGNFRPTGHSSWRNNWAGRLDLSGISWNDSRTATLIDPQHVVMAAHFTRPAEVPVVFHDRGGKAHSRRITAVRSLPGTDIAVGKLDAPLPPEVTRYPFASVSDATPGTPAVVTDKTGTLFVHRIAAVAGGTVRFDYFPDLDPVYRVHLVGGDSGHPSFIVKNGRLFLLETHSGGGAGSGPFYGDSGNQNAIRAAIQDMAR